MHFYVEMKDYQLVKYKNKKFCVCRYSQRDDTNKLFVIDAESLNPMLKINRSWYKVNGHIGYAKKINGKIFYNYLHDLITKRKNSGSKTSKYKICHINDNIHDIRKVNLKITNQNEINQSKRKTDKQCKLPLNSRIKSSDIPKCVHYCGPQSGHGEMFVIEISNNGKKYVWKSSSSKNILLSDKLIEIKKKLLDIYKQHPNLIENKRILENYNDKQISLMKDFNNIINLSTYKNKRDNLIKIPKKIVVKANTNNCFKETRKYLATNTAIKSGRRHINKIPSNSGIIPAMIPKYCYYVPATNKRSDAFIIDRHPYLPKGKRIWVTSTSKNISTAKKFSQLKAKLNELKNKNKRYSGSKSRR
jgi:hypothetical protein